MMQHISELSGYSLLPEPQLVFAGGQNDRHPLRGLVNFGPYSKTLGVPTRIRVAQLAPTGQLRKLDSILNELTRSATPREAKNYYPSW